MAQLFYDHLIIIEEIITVVGKDKKTLELVDRILQHEILDAIFSYLPKEKHREFLTKFHAAPHDTSLIDYLNSHASINMELVILDRANKTKRKLLKHLSRVDK